jgi:hypothetical protein
MNHASATHASRFQGTSASWNCWSSCLSGTIGRFACSAGARCSCVRCASALPSSSSQPFSSSSSLPRSFAQHPWRRRAECREDAPRNHPLSRRGACRRHRAAVAATRSFVRAIRPNASAAIRRRGTGHAASALEASCYAWPSKLLLAGRLPLQCASASSGPKRLRPVIDAVVSDLSCSRSHRRTPLASAGQLTR